MLTRIFAFVALALSLALVASPARAEWHKAESERFVIYSDSSEKHVREFAERLERYHAAMSNITGLKPPVPSPSSRVTVYAVGSDRNLRKLYGDKSSSVAGFYIPRAAGSVAFVPNVKLSGRETDFTLIILLHEYAHHFTISSSAIALPRWITEGSAEFFAGVRFKKDGALDIGLPAIHRRGELSFGNQLSIREILDYDRIASEGAPKNNAFYGQAWLLYHYVMFNEQRFPQYAEYGRKYAQGMPSLQAAEEAFGDLDQLEKELKAYRRNTRWRYIPVGADSLQIGKITVTELSEGMGEMMDVILQSRRGVTQEEALELLPDAREIAGKYPDDPGVLSALAEAEFDAGNDAEAIAAADKAIAIDRMQKNAYVQKGYALFRLAEEAEGDALDAAYEAAMEPFEALNAIENDHPLPLIYYYRSFVQRGAEPEDNARAALEYASQLAPFDQGLRLNVAVMYMGNGQNALARQTLAPLAADPHGSSRSARAKRLMAELDGTPDGTMIDLSLLNDESDDEGSEGAGTDEGE